MPLMEKMLRRNLVRYRWILPKIRNLIQTETRKTNIPLGDFKLYRQRRFRERWSRCSSKTGAEEIRNGEPVTQTEAG